MFLKFNQLNQSFECSYYEDPSTSSYNFSFSNVADIQSLTNMLQTVSMMEAIKVYQDPECSVEVVTLVEYCAANINADYDTGSVVATLKPQNINKQINRLTDQLAESTKIINELHTQVKDVTNIVKPTPIDLSSLTLSEAKEYQLNQVNTECTETIRAGIDVELSNGTIEHFSLTTEDQMNLSVITNEILTRGAAEVPYHADGQLCKFYSAQDFMKIAVTAENYKTYCVTLCNHLRAWINRSETKEQVYAINFKSTLPDDLYQNFIYIMNSQNTNVVETTEEV